MQSMTMYVDFLSLALEGWSTDLTRSALIDHALACRIDMLDHGFRRGDSAFDALAVEVVYDRALIRLCDACDIKIELANFTQPRAERSRLEHELVLVGVDLMKLAREARLAHS